MCQALPDPSPGLLLTRGLGERLQLVDEFGRCLAHVWWHILLASGEHRVPVAVERFRASSLSVTLHAVLLATDPDSSAQPAGRARGVAASAPPHGCVPAPWQSRALSDRRPAVRQPGAGHEAGARWRPGARRGR